MISIRQHCIPAYDELSRLRSVEEIPSDIESMEEKTAVGIVHKVRAVLESEYFNSLPETKVIESGAIINFLWQKEDARCEMQRIWDECKSFL